MKRHIILLTFFLASTCSTSYCPIASITSPLYDAYFKKPKAWDEASRRWTIVTSINVFAITRTIMAKKLTRDDYLLTGLSLSGLILLLWEPVYLVAQEIDHNIGFIRRYSKALWITTHYFMGFGRTPYSGEDINTQISMRDHQEERSQEIIVDLKYTLKKRNEAFESVEEQLSSASATIAELRAATDKNLLSKLKKREKELKTIEEELRMTKDALKSAKSTIDELERKHGASQLPKPTKKRSWFSRLG